ncbi:MAG: HD domain-containing protein [Lachnospiraceae bacterium]|nr:HD domain-containing protein [Lachnospiraceae bacterium]
MFPQNVIKIAKTLKNAGFDAYVVGGAVRDTVLCKLPHDYDIATNATPAQVKELFDRTIDTGIEHGTVTAMFGKEGYEITTYRCDGKYSDGRHPDSVSFVDTIEDDLSRRDFTMNAMAIDPVTEELVDPFGGETDLHMGVIRTVGNAEDRFKEDALRMMRAARFKAQFGFTIEHRTYDAMTDMHGLISGLSKERIHEELNKTLQGRFADIGIKAMELTGILREISPELSEMFYCGQETPWHYENVGSHSLSVLMNAKEKGGSLNVLWAALLHDMGKPEAKVIKEDGSCHFHNHAAHSGKLAYNLLRELKFSNAEIDRIVKLVEYHDTVYADIKDVRTFVAAHDKDFLDELYILQLADAMAHTPRYAEEAVAEKEAFRKDILTVIRDKTAIRIKDLKIDGSDLKELGYEEGIEIGLELEKLWKLCIEDPSLNDEKTLYDLAEKDLKDEERDER